MPAIVDATRVIGQDCTQCDGSGANPVRGQRPRAQLHTLLLGAVRARGGVLDLLGDEDTAQRLNPWLFGDRCVIGPLQARLDDPAPIEPGEYANFVFIALRLEPLIGIASTFLGRAPLPLPDELDAVLRTTWAAPPSRPRTTGSA